MKKILTIILATITLAATAQADSLKAVQDSIRLSQDSIQLEKVKAKSLAIQPIVVSMAGDTAFYLHWKAFDVDRADTSVGMGTLVSLLDRKGKVLVNFNVHIPAEVTNHWALDPKPIDDFILQQNPRIKRKVQ